MRTLSPSLRHLDAGYSLTSWIFGKPSVCSSLIVPRVEERILHVDDEPGVSEVTRNTLSLCSFEVDADNDTEEALSKFDEGRHDKLLLLDYGMPTMTGFLSRTKE